MKILLQGDLFMKTEILRQCLEDVLSDLDEPLEFKLITLPTPAGEEPLPGLDDGESPAVGIDL